MTDEDLIEGLIAEADAATTDDADELYRKAAARLSELHAENQRLREALQAARRAMNYEWVKYYQWGMSVPTSLKKAINGAVRVLGEEGGAA